MEVSTASETEEDPIEGESTVEEATGSECERKRRKQAEETIPRLVIILKFLFLSRSSDPLTNHLLSTHTQFDERL